MIVIRRELEYQYCVGAREIGDGTEGELDMALEAKMDIKRRNRA